MRRAILFTLFILPLGLFAQTSSSVTTLEKHREAYISQLLLNPRSPLDSTTIFGLRFFEPNDSFTRETIILPLSDTSVLNFPTSDGSHKPYRRYAKIFFRFGESLHQLTVYQSLANLNHPLYKNKLFLPFRDYTNGETSYGGGRYLEVYKSSIDQRSFVIDFNRAYNPWCAYSEDFSCPIPPAENSLELYINAGEAIFRGPKS